MLVFEFKLRVSKTQQAAIDEAIRTMQFLRNKALRYWMDHKGVGKYDLNKQAAILAAEFDFANKLNSMARQSACERAWTGISRFFEACKAKRPGKKGYPRFQKNNRSVEYKTTGWKLSEDRKRINFTDGHKIGLCKLIGSRDLNFYQPEQIKRVRIVRRADGYYAQFSMNAQRHVSGSQRREDQTLTGSMIGTQPAGMIGLDVGLESFYTDSNGVKLAPPRFLRKAEKRLKRAQRKVSRKVKGSANRRKAVRRLSRQHLKVQRQRKDFVVKAARCVIQSNDLVVYENLKIRNMAKNPCLAKSIHDAGWYQFRSWLEYFGKVFGKITIAVNPAHTSQRCSACGVIVVKSLSTRRHACACGCFMDRDENAAINILRLGISTALRLSSGATSTRQVATGHVETQNASGDLTSTDSGFTSSQQVESRKEEFLSL
jgi:putative transposase